MKETARTIGRVDHLVFAVGTGSGKFGFPFWDLEAGRLAAVLETNVLTAVNTLHAFVPAMIEAKGGTILLISSVAGQIGSQTDPPYSAGEGGPHQLRPVARPRTSPRTTSASTRLFLGW